MEKGDCHSLVTALNSRLKSLGYLSGSINPSYDQKTEDAVKLLAEVNKLGDSICDNDLQTFLYGNEVVECPENLRPHALDDTVPSNPNQVISDRQLKIIRKWLTKQFAVNHTEKQAVKRLQMQLVRLGYLSSEHVTMIYDQKTFNAVQVFQTSNDLSADGIASKNTLTEIFRSEIDRSDEYEDE